MDLLLAFAAGALFVIVLIVGFLMIAFTLESLKQTILDLPSRLFNPERK